MSSGRIIASFNIKDPEVHTVYKKVTEVKGLLSEICCNALMEWNEGNLNVDDVKSRIEQIRKDKEALEAKEQSLTQKLAILQNTAIHNKEQAKKETEDKAYFSEDIIIRRLIKDFKEWFFPSPDADRLFQLAVEYQKRKDSAATAEDYMPILFEIMQRENIRFTKHFKFLARHTLPDALLPLEHEAKKRVLSFRGSNRGVNMRGF